MERNINEEKKLKSKSKKILIVSYACYVITYLMYVYKDFYLLFIRAGLTLLKVDLYFQDIIIFLITNLLLALPIGICITSQMKRRKIEREIIDLKEYQRMHPVIKKDTSKVIEEKLKQQQQIQSIIDRFEKLPREKQVEILNYIKGSININKDSLYKDIDLLYSTNELQDKIEDILFPSFENKEYKKIKNKNK